MNLLTENSSFIYVHPSPDYGDMLEREEVRKQEEALLGLNIASSTVLCDVCELSFCLAESPRGGTYLVAWFADPMYAERSYRERIEDRDYTNESGVLDWKLLEDRVASIGANM